MFPCGWGTEADIWRAANEGWMLDSLGGVWHIADVGSAGTAGNREREKFVHEQADKGSEFHIRALAALAALRITEA